MPKLFHVLSTGLVFLLSSCNLFLPVDPLPPSVSEVSIIQVSAATATVGATIENPDGKNDRQHKKSGPITEFGFVYATQDKPTLEGGTGFQAGNLVTTDPFQFQGKISGLNLGTTYYVRSYAKNEGGGVAYGQVASFVTGNYVLPLLTLGKPINLTQSSADLVVTISSPGTAAISSFGVCYSSTNDSPTISDGKTEIPARATVGDFTATLVQLKPGIPYFARAFAMTSAGIAYSRTITFTLGEPSLFLEKKSFTLYYSNRYDLDLGELVSQFGAEDLTWYPADDKPGIYPKNGARFAVLGKLNFDLVKYSDITKAVLSADFINGSYTDTNANKLANGTVIAYLTNQGRYGKMYIDAHGQDRPVGGAAGGDMQVTIVTYNK
jgi:hypothetical protein